MTTNDWPYKTIAIDPAAHRAVRLRAAECGITLKDMAEHLIRLGMIAEAEKQTRLAEPKAEYDVEDH